MSTQPNFLRLYRKRSPISQADIAFLMCFPDYSNISRYEKGQRTPTIELLLIYHHLFNASVESFFEHQSESIRFALVERIQELISSIGKEKNSTINVHRIKFLEQTFTRLEHKNP